MAFMRGSLLLIVVLLVKISFAFGEENNINFNIPPSSADKALNLFAQQADVQLLYSYKDVANKQLNGVSGLHSIQQGWEILLESSCLYVELEDDTSRHLLADNNKGIATVNSHQCKKNNFLKTFTTSLLAILGSQAAVTQEVTPQKSASTIEEVIVSARRQNESLQSTPVAVTALTSSMLDVKQIDSIESIQYSTPNLNISTKSPNSSGFAFLSIRGQANLGGGASNDPAIGVYVDGVYIARPGGSLLDLIDTRQVEVLRGPQGTLFGRNTTGGALNIKSNEPVNVLKGSLKLSLGNIGQREVTGMVNVPLIEDTLAARLVYKHSEHDGYGDNVFLNKELNDDKRDFFRFSMKYSPADSSWDFLLSADRTDQEDNGQLHVVTDYNSDNALLSGFVQANGPDENGPGSADDNIDPYVHSNNDWYNGYSDDDEFSELTAQGVSGKLNIDLGWAKLTSITAWRSLETTGFNDLDGLPYRIINSNYVNDQSQFSQELQLSGGDGALNWISGLFYFDEEGEELTRSQTMFGALFSNDPDLVNRNDGTANNTSYAAYGQLYYDLTDSLRLTGGLRYTVDDREVELRNKSNEALDVCSIPVADRDDGINCRQNESVDYDYVSYLFGVDYQINEQAFLYAKTSRAYLAGGWNMRNGSAPSFEPEEVTDVELGAKLDWLDSRIRTNIALFRAEQADVQRTSTGIIPKATSFIRNAAEATVTGVEFELTALPWEGMEASFTFGWLDAEYDTFIDATGLDRSQETPPQSPEYNYSISVTQQVYTRFGELKIHADYAYVDDYVLWQGTAPDPATEALFARGRQLSEAGGYGLLNAKATMQLDDRWEVSLWGRNLTDEEYYSRTQADFLTSFGYAGAYPGDPRTYGVTVAFQFD